MDITFEHHGAHLNEALAPYSTQFSGLVHDDSDSAFFSVPTPYLMSYVLLALIKRTNNPFVVFVFCFYFNVDHMMIISFQFLFCEILIEAWKAQQREGIQLTN